MAQPAVVHDLAAHRLQDHPAPFVPPFMEVPKFLTGRYGQLRYEPTPRDWIQWQMDQMETLDGYVLVRAFALQAQDCYNRGIITGSELMFIVYSCAWAEEFSYGDCVKRDDGLYEGRIGPKPVDPDAPQVIETVAATMEDMGFAALADYFETTPVWFHQRVVVGAMTLSLDVCPNNEAPCPEGAR